MRKKPIGGILKARSTTNNKIPTTKYQQQNTIKIHYFSKLSGRWRLGNNPIVPKNYCISKMYDSTESDDLMHIIAVLRKFKYILETEILE